MAIDIGDPSDAYFVVDGFYGCEGPYPGNGSVFEGRFRWAKSPFVIRLPVFPGVDNTVIVTARIAPGDGQRLTFSLDGSTVGDFGFRADDTYEVLLPADAVGDRRWVVLKGEVAQRHGASPNDDRTLYAALGQLEVRGEGDERLIAPVEWKRPLSEDLSTSAAWQRGGEIIARRAEFLEPGLPEGVELASIQALSCFAYAGGAWREYPVQVLELNRWGQVPPENPGVLDWFDELVFPCPQAAGEPPAGSEPRAGSEPPGEWDGFIGITVRDSLWERELHGPRVYYRLGSGLEPVRPTGPLSLARSEGRIAFRYGGDDVVELATAEGFAARRLAIAGGPELGGTWRWFPAVFTDGGATWEPASVTDFSAVAPAGHQVVVSVEGKLSAQGNDLTCLGLLRVFAWPEATVIQVQDSAQAGKLATADHAMASLSLPGDDWVAYDRVHRAPGFPGIVPLATTTHRWRSLQKVSGGPVGTLACAESYATAFAPEHVAEMDHLVSFADAGGVHLGLRARPDAPVENWRQHNHYYLFLTRTPQDAETVFKRLVVNPLIVTARPRRSPPVARLYQCAAAWAGMVCGELIGPGTCAFGVGLGGEPQGNTTAPPLLELVTLYEKTRDPLFLDKARQAADYVIGHQDPDGYLPVHPESTDDAMTLPHVAYTVLGLAALNRHVPNSAYLEAIRKVTDWIREHRCEKPSGKWIYWTYHRKPEGWWPEKADWLVQNFYWCTVYLRLYQLTGDEEYRRRAEQILDTMDQHPIRGKTFPTMGGDRDEFINCIVPMKPLGEGRGGSSICYSDQTRSYPAYLTVAEVLPDSERWPRDKVWGSYVLPMLDFYHSTRPPCVWHHFSHEFMSAGKGDRWESEGFSVGQPDNITPAAEGAMKLAVMTGAPREQTRQDFLDYFGELSQHGGLKSRWSNKDNGSGRQWGFGASVSLPETWMVLGYAATRGYLTREEYDLYSWKLLSLLDNHFVSPTPTTAGWLESLNYRSGDSPSKVIKATGIGGGDAVSHYFSFLHCVLDGLLTVESSSLDGASLQVRAANTTPWQPAWAERAALVPLPSALPDGARAALDVDGKPWRVTGLRAVSIAGNPFALVTAANPEGDAG